jgi:hypothetical protein
MARKKNNMKGLALEAALRAQYPFHALAEPSGGWTILFPDAPGAGAFAETWEEIGPKALEGITIWLTVSAERGQTLPPPTTVGDFRYSATGQALIDAERPLIDPAKQELFSVRDVAAYAGISTGRVRQIAGEKHVGTLIGGALIFHREDLRAFTHRRPAGRPRKVDTATAAD